MSDSVGYTILNYYTVTEIPAEIKIGMKAKNRDEGCGSEKPEKAFQNFT